MMRSFGVRASIGLLLIFFVGLGLAHAFIANSPGGPLSSALWNQGGLPDVLNGSPGDSGGLGTGTVGINSTDILLQYQAPGTTINDSPVPIGGYSRFFGYCSQGNLFQRLVVCAGGSCDPNSPNLVCSTDYSLQRRPSCVAPAPLARWGNTTMTSACCVQNGSCSSLVTDNWIVGVNQVTGIPGSSLSAVRDFRTSKVVRLSYTEWIEVIDGESGSTLASTVDRGVSWSPSFALNNLVGMAALPSGESPGSVAVVNPTIFSNGGSVIHLVMGFRDTTTNKSSLYYSWCSALPCTSAGNWHNPTPILNALFDVDAAGKWKYIFRAPKILIDQSRIHILFDDADSNPATRAAGIFHRYCDIVGSPVSCLSVNDWHSPLTGTDILQGGSAGFPHSPSMVVDPTHVLYAAWVDNGPSGQSNIFYSRYSASTNQWSSFSKISNTDGYSNPQLAPTTKGITAVAQNGSGIMGAWNCQDAGCTPAQSVWNDVSSMFTGLNALSNVSSPVFLYSPVDPDRQVVLVSALSQGLAQLYGVFILSLNAQGPFLLTRVPGSGAVILGSGSPLQSNLAAGMEWVDLVSQANNVIVNFFSNVLDITNAVPQLSGFSAVHAPTWHNPASGDWSITPYTEPVVFTVQDANPEDILYATLAAGAAPGLSTYTLVDHQNLNQMLGNTSGSSCSGTSFVSSSGCSMDVPLYLPLSGLSMPDGVYYFTLTLQDSAGGSTTATMGPITVDASPVSLSVQSPVSGDDWNPSVGSTLVRLIAQTPVFAHSLDGGIVIRSQSTGGLYNMVVNLATNAGPSSLCVQSGSASVPVYQCQIPFSPPAGLAEGLYDFNVSIFEDSISNGSQTIPGVTLDYLGPKLVGSSPTGSVPGPPASIGFTLSDLHGLPVSPSPTVTVLGIPSSPVVCTPSNSGSILTCTAPFPDSTAQGLINVSIVSTDNVANSSTHGYSFFVSSPETCPVGQVCDQGNGNGNPGNGGNGGAGGVGGTTIVEVLTSGIQLPNIIHQNENGDWVIPGVGVIPRTVVESFNTLSHSAISTAEDLVEVTGPSANAIFLGLCVLAGLASDVVFRRIFTQIEAETQRQRERVLRTVLAGVFCLLPLFVGWQFRLPIGFVFAVLEVVGFLGASYVYKILQYYDTFGFKPVEAPK